MQDQIVGMIKIRRFSEQIVFKRKRQIDQRMVKVVMRFEKKLFQIFGGERIYFPVAFDKYFIVKVYEIGF